MIDDWLRCSVALLAVSTVLPILPVVQEMTEQVPASRRGAYKTGALLQANLAAAGFVLLSPVVFGALGVNLDHLRIAGGVVLMVYATHDILFSRVSRKHRQLHDDNDALPPAIAPLGLPVLVGPATLSTLLVLTEVHGLLAVAFAWAVNLGLNAALLLASDRIFRAVGEGTSRAIGKVMSLVLATLGAGMLEAGIRGAVQ